jgi:hypothetical protein
MSSYGQSTHDGEARYVYEEALEFRIRARRDHLLGLWIGQSLGLSGDELALYAGTVMTADLVEPGDEDVIEKVMADLVASGSTLTEPELRHKMNELLGVARREVRIGE